MSIISNFWKIEAAEFPQNGTPTEQFKFLLNQPIEVPTLRSQLSKLIYALSYPQILLRLGFGSEVKPTARRGVDEVLL